MMSMMNDQNYQIKMMIMLMMNVLSLSVNDESIIVRMMMVVLLFLKSINVMVIMIKMMMMMMMICSFLAFINPQILLSLKKWCSTTRFVVLWAIFWWSPIFVGIYYSFIHKNIYRQDYFYFLGEA